MGEQKYFPLDKNEAKNQFIIFDKHILSIHQELLDLKQQRPGGVQIVEEIRKQANDVSFSFPLFSSGTFDLS